MSSHSWLWVYIWNMEHEFNTFPLLSIWHDTRAKKKQLVNQWTAVKLPTLKNEILQISLIHCKPENQPHHVTNHLSGEDFPPAANTQTQHQQHNRRPPQLLNAAELRFRGSCSLICWSETSKQAILCAAVAGIISCASTVSSRWLQMQTSLFPDISLCQHSAFSLNSCVNSAEVCAAPEHLHCSIKNCVQYFKLIK